MSCKGFIRQHFGLRDIEPHTRPFTFYHLSVNAFSTKDIRNLIHKMFRTAHHRYQRFWKNVLFRFFTVFLD